jgi:hypothetical protein
LIAARLFSTGARVSSPKTCTFMFHLSHLLAGKPSVGLSS